MVVRSAVADRRAYLLRPDLGRRLRADDRAKLPITPGAILFVVCDGLSAIAVQRHAPVLLAHVVPVLQRAGHAVAPIVVAEQGRVALGDDIGESMDVDAVAVLIGERPGLTAPDSLGVYLTWQPRRGRTDAERNCISNIRPEGLAPLAAARQAVMADRSYAALAADRCRAEGRTADRAAGPIDEWQKGTASALTTGIHVFAHCSEGSIAARQPVDALCQHAVEGTIRVTVDLHFTRPMRFRL